MGKCRYCCSIASFFCWGTTHFCRACHRNSLELTSMIKLVQCPCKPKGNIGLPAPYISKRKKQITQQSKSVVSTIQKKNNVGERKSKNPKNINKILKKDDMTGDNKYKNEKNDYAKRSIQNICPLLGV